MLVYPQKVKVTWNGSNKNHFESKGYKYTKRGEEFKVDVHTLANGSNYEVKVECDYCGRIYDYPYSKYLRAVTGKIGKISCNNKECRKKHKQEIASLQKYSIEEVRTYFSEHGCKLLETEYKGYKELHEFRCKCGKITKKSFSDFKNKSSQCKYCSIEENSNNQRLGYDFVKSYYKEKGCELLELEYRNNSTHMKYKCKCGNEYKKSFDAFKASTLCLECAYKKRAESRRRPLEEVKNIFEVAGCRLLEHEYKDNHTKMKYICVCGRPSEITLSKFLDGDRCRQCYLDNNKGENNPAWNPNKTNEEREDGRILEGYKDWKKTCRERDNYTCQCCKRRGGELHVHHIYNYAEYAELRVTIDNGITLCQKCHKGKDGFHDLYGNNGSNPEQFIEFLEHNKAFYTAQKVINFKNKIKLEDKNG